mmetsp:Transcript_13764/g.9928  ORF Transcript_13764/g.9928 Transcript_13764/m.9928 type:complete len:105 (+) Transcript_13764:640-954(+)
MRKEEALRAVDELQRAIDSLRARVEEARRKRQEDLAFIENAHYTSDEEEMGISPSNYDVLNQRFNSKEDAEVYLNTNGEAFGELAGSTGKMGKFKGNKPGEIDS